MPCGVCGVRDTACAVCGVRDTACAVCGVRDTVCVMWCVWSEGHCVCRVVCVE